MKLLYISKNSRRYLSLGKEFPNKKDESANEIDVDDSLGKLLLMERDGSNPVWQENKRRKKVEEEIQEVI